MAISREQEQSELFTRIWIQTAPNIIRPSGLDHFDLFMLPPELRLLIYEFAVVDSKPRTFIRQVEKERSWAPLQQPPITRTCREIREETIKLFYSCNTFEFHDPNVTIDCLYRDIRSGMRPGKIVRTMGLDSVPFRDVFDWLRRIGHHNVAKIRNLKIQLTPRDLSDDANRALALSKMETARAEIQDVLLHYSRHVGFALPSEITLERHERHPGEHEQTGYKTFTLEFFAGGSTTALGLRAVRLRSVVQRWKMFRWKVLRLGLCPYPRGLPKIAALEVFSNRGPWMARR